MPTCAPDPASEQPHLPSSLRATTCICLLRSATTALPPMVELEQEKKERQSGSSPRSSCIGNGMQHVRIIVKEANASVPRTMSINLFINRHLGRRKSRSRSGKSQTTLHYNGLKAVSLQSCAVVSSKNHPLADASRHSRAFWVNPW
ncbi:hypothetical protein SORBI_3010G144100 [Sorghum bicolor]|uniref:Uncharacterized protein n=1 Tax=Sorghum bicolor TaxID=4558 RepID=A0A1W0VT17_SORBI|nr:hypothetical protein SORBI_3010G144100 [Sorghum bicolor]OQU76433.1 hypothetical protein SORBI_3010G144100 [Sorghum bicolor]